MLVTDAAGIVTLMNPVGERLTGWTSGDAQGKDSRIVFDIVNETTRAAVESPVERAIREGVIVGLANHTILRRRDGTEIAIDDSGAPVRDGKGRLTGAVLVFRDVTERRTTEIDVSLARFGARRSSMRIGAAIRDSPLDAEEVLRTAVRALGEGIGADRCYYARYDQARDFARLRPDWHREGLDSIEGDYPMSQFSINRDSAYKRGEMQVVDDLSPVLQPGFMAARRFPVTAGSASGCDPSSQTSRSRLLEMR